MTLGFSAASASPFVGRASSVCSIFLFFVFYFAISHCVSGQTNVAAVKSPNNLVVMAQGTVEVLRSGTGRWFQARQDQILAAGDLVRTGERSRAEIYLTNGLTIQMKEISEQGIPPMPGVVSKSGWLKYFNRGKGFNDNVHGGTAAVRGTDFLVRVEDERTELTVLDGEVSLRNGWGEVVLTNNEVGIIENGAVPRKIPLPQPVNDLIQWSFYYPAVLDADELDFNSNQKKIYAAALDAYRSGDLLQAVAKFPWETKPMSDDDRAFRATLSLAVGQVEQAQTLLREISGESAEALHQLIAAIKFQTRDQTRAPNSSADWLAKSYYQQSRSKLEEALQAAQTAVEKNPKFGFAWARVAELEFSFGRTEKSLAALEKSLKISQRNPQAISLQGFLLAAQNKIPAAISNFDEAIAIDGALGNAWLGRGLCSMRQNRIEDGLRDLHIAASLESQRSVLRSYLGKAFAEIGDQKHAEKELVLARQLDPNDPTGWLYSALLNQERYRINDAVRDLERSQELNDNRRLFRSRLLLDQDRAVRSANLAGIYRDAGMFDVSLREASRAVASDYANYSSHLFLANSYSQLSDPNLVSLRYETATFSEYLLANLLAPVGASTLSQNISQQEYSKLFERDRLGASSSTTYLSNGDWQQDASQFGTVGNTAYAVDGIYRSFNGQRRNNDLEQSVFSAQLKQQLTAQDSVYLQVIYNNFKSGDLAQYYNYDKSTNYDSASPNFQARQTEKQEPNLFVGYHREWTPGAHTLFLAGRLNDTVTFSNPGTAIRLFSIDSSGQLNFANSVPVRFDANYRADFDAYTTEIQQIWQNSKNSLVAGGRFQTGKTSAHSGVILTDPNSNFYSTILSTNYRQSFETDLERLSFYTYDNWQICEPFSISVGATFDHLRFPENAGSPPISGQEETKQQVSPKAGFIWTPRDSTSIRGAYTRSLGGLSYDQSVRLEPTQVAGFNQAYRSLFPESLVGSVPGSEFETFQLGLDHKFRTRTYFVFEAAILQSSASQNIGVFEFEGTPFAQPSSARQQLDFEEQSLSIALNQLVGERWSFGARYRLSQSELEIRSPEIPASSDDRAVLQQWNIFGIYNHPTGFFAEAQSLWWGQKKFDDSSDLPGDYFWQFNLFGGYRFPKRRGEIVIGLANITDQNYRLNPLSLYGELPRERTLFTSLKFNF